MSNNRRRTIDVEIYDQKYSIVPKAPMQEADVRKIAEEVDARMREIASASHSPDSLKVAVLAALHLAQDLLELRRSIDQNDAVILRKSDEWAHALEELLSK